SGLPGGTWDLTASLYDTDGSAAGTAANWDLGSKPSGTTGQPLLLFSARQQIAVQTATGSSVNLLVYRPGDIGSVTVMEPSFVKTVTVADSVAQVVDAQGQPATEQRVTWSADDPSVQVIPVPGSAPPMALVKGTKEGSFAVKATSAESVPTNNPDLYGAFALDVEPPVYGTWQGNVGDGTTFLSVYRDTQGRLAFEMVTPGQYFFDLRGLISVDPSGSTWEFLQTQDSTWDSSGIKTWNSVSGEVWDFAATMSPTGAFLEIPTYETSFGSVGQALIPTNQTLSIATPPTFIVGMTQQLHAQWSPDPLVPDVIWTTSDPSIATVDPVSGSVTFLLAGQNVLITAISRLNPALSASVTLGASPLPDPFGAGNGIVTSVVPDNTVQGGWQVAGMTGGTGLFEPRVFTSHRTTLGGQDAGFAGLGYFILPPTPSVWGQNYYGHGSMGIGAVQLPTGGLVVDQYLQNGIGNIGLYRYQPDGSAFAGYAGVASVVPIVRPVVDDGGAVYTVVRGSSPFTVVRLDNKGQVDGTYQANSSQSANSLFNGGFLPWTSAVYPSTDPDGNAGKFLVAGENPGGAFPLVRLLADGTPDTAFNTAVSTLSGLLSVDANVTSLAVTGIRISGSTIAFVVQNTGST
ncbi:MAG TPA: hypothetical protein VMB23_05735, partial [Spirochaetia bacterium]|nr:hypothetical protein [Spirochaetia bacterium]